MPVHAYEVNCTTPGRWKQRQITSVANGVRAREFAVTQRLRHCTPWVIKGTFSEIKSSLRVAQLEAQGQEDRGNLDVGNSPLRPDPLIPGQ